METIPFIPGRNNEKLSVTLNGAQYIFFVRWNARDNIDPSTGEARGAWYFDLYESDETPIAIGMKIVLGPPLGRAHQYHPFFQKNILQVVDLSGEGRDAAFDDLGGRIQVIRLTEGSN